MSDASVVIAGAGPNGLMLACELALAGVQAVVLDPLPGPSDEPKANGLVGQVVRQLDMRGLYRRFTEAVESPKPIPQWMFSGMAVPLAGVADNPVYTLLMPQPRLVALLTDRARELGADIRWGHELIGFAQHSDGVAVSVVSAEETSTLHAAYLVGADGGRSRVRKLAGIEFPGHTSNVVSRIAEVSLPSEMRREEGYLEVPGYGPVRWGHNRLDRGGFIYAEFEHTGTMLGTIEFDAEGVDVDDSAPMTVQELQDSARRVLGVEVPITAPGGVGPHAMRRIAGQNTRQADHYRSGNVLLLGDSAHVHSAMGGPGLNLGLQDAVNLGWKLAATVKGGAPDGLLDTYHSERHPVGRRVMMHSMSQAALMSPGAEITELRELFAELMELPQVASHIAHLLAGSDVRYDVGDGHPLSGRLVPDLVLDDGRRVADLLHDARPILIGTGVDRTVPVEVVDARIAGGPAAMLIRPDGYVAWACDALDSDAEDRLGAALARWFS